MSHDNFQVVIHREDGALCAQCRTCGWVTTRYPVLAPINAIYAISPEMEAECHRHSRQPSAPTLDLVAQAA